MFDEKYDSLLTTYLNYEFKSKHEENEYLNHIKSLIDDGNVGFEEKMSILQFLISGVKAGCRIPEITPA